MGKSQPTFRETNSFHFQTGLLGNKDYSRRGLYSVTARVVHGKSTDVSKEHIVSNFRVKEPARFATRLRAVFLNGLFQYTEDGGDKLIRNDR
jgi:hypothetical protein